MVEDRYKRQWAIIALFESFKICRRHRVDSTKIAAAEGWLIDELLVDNKIYGNQHTRNEPKNPQLVHEYIDRELRLGYEWQAKLHIPNQNGPFD